MKLKVVRFVIYKMKTENIYTVSQLRINPKLIPKESGIYIWTFSPNINTENEKSFLRSIEMLTSKEFFLEHSGNISYNKMAIKRVSFPEKTLFRLSSSKNKTFNQYTENSDFRVLFSNEISRICLNNVILYIGKADNLRTRLTNHIEGNKSNLLEKLSKANFLEDELRIKIIKDEENSLFQEFPGVNLIIEETLQRMVLPGFVERFG